MATYVYVTHSLPHTSTGRRLPATAQRLVAHYPAMSPLDLNYRTRSAVFQAKRDGYPYRLPMVCRWFRTI